MGTGLCVFLRVQCEMRELVPNHVLISNGYEQVSSATVDLHPYSSASSASSSSSSLPLGLPHPMHSTLASQHVHNTHPMRIDGHHGMNNNHGMPLKSLYHQDPIMAGGPGGGDSNTGLLLSGIAGHRTHYDGLGGDMTSGVAHGSGSNGSSVGSGDIYSGNYPQYMHPDISQGMTGTASVLHSQHGHWTPIFGGRQGPGLYMEHDQSGMSYLSSQNPGSYPIVFPALSSLSSSLPDGVSKVQLPLPVRTQASEISSSNINLRPSTIGATLANDTISYGNQSTSYRSYSSWGGDPSFPSAPQSTSLISASQQAVSTGIPALPAPSITNIYGSHSGPVFSLSSSNSSLLPTTSRDISSISNSPTDPFCTQSHTQQQQKDRSNSESSSGSRAAPAMRTNSTSSSSYSPTYSRSSGGYHHSHLQLLIII